MIHKVRHLVTVIGNERTRMDLRISNRQRAPSTRRSASGRGQGSGNGHTAGRGHKGAKSRSGFKFKRGFEGGQMPLHRRIPKRGFHNPFRVEYEVVNLDTLAERFEAGTVVTPESLVRARAWSTGKQPHQGAGARRREQGAHGAGAQVQRQGCGEDCRGRRSGRGDRVAGGRVHRPPWIAAHG